MPNRGPVTLIMQEELLRGLDPEPAVVAAGHEVVRFSSGQDWKRILADLDHRLGPRSPMEPMTGRRVACFVSLEVAGHIRRHCGHLDRGVFLREERLQLHKFSGLMPEEWLLNSSFVLISLGQVPGRTAQIERLFGPELFIRPDSPMKEFAGTPVRTCDLAEEISAIRQIHHLHGDLLVAIDRARKIAPHEYRFWLADGETLTHAPYGFLVSEPAPPCPAAIRDLAVRVARAMEGWENPVVADFVLDEAGAPRLVELNGFSTSGFYEGVDFGAIARKLDEILF
ncbi:ATP-grasp domain-containing protein [Defluviimonas salinarum]|uniref:ATP-grasp domain-containing protein n=1 Tax=Defluviimonas salinarum TaxID=2992147 RepID=A0ABT3J4B7_9RHOB|nr:ATP-grasp domain-containing protein [Defluviimonas salinarum]MCW3782518.1 ATP-grasp domain-containing protein [Defluviimonas salinarum]